MTPEEIAEEIKVQFIASMKWANDGKPYDQEDVETIVVGNLNTITHRFADAIRAERTHPAPEEIKKYLRHDQRCAFLFGEVGKAEGLPCNCGLEEILIRFPYPGLVAVECQSCKGIKAIEQGILKARCPQNCDNGRVWVRKGVSK